MIVAVTGTGLPFTRLVEALAEHHRRTGEPCWVQHGKAKLPAGLDGAPTVPRPELLQRMGAADVVVAHAGCGTMLDALSQGHVPVVVPRLKRYGEHVNDHQLELLEALECEGRIVAVRELDGLAQALETARGRRELSPEVRGADLKRELVGDISEFLRRRRRRCALIVIEFLTRKVHLPLEPADTEDRGDATLGLQNNECRRGQ